MAALQMSRKEAPLNKAQEAETPQVDLPLIEEGRGQ